MITAIRTFDNSVIESFMRLPEIFKTAAEDGQKPEDFKSNCQADCWLLMMCGDEFIGAYKIHALNKVTAAIHANVLPVHRKKYSHYTGLAALQWIIDNTDYQKVVATIPVIYGNVKRFTSGFGFNQEGISTNSYLKNGSLVDQYLLGITRDEILETLKESIAA
jgi:hypothetical protein